MLTFCKSLLPVITGTLRGCERMSKMIGRWTHGMKKCVPSPTTPCLIPWKRSKITARWPPSTVNDKLRRNFRRLVNHTHNNICRLTQFHSPLYNAELTTLPAIATPKPSWPMRLNNCAILIYCCCGSAKEYEEWKNTQINKWVSICGGHADRLRLCFTARYYCFTSICNFPCIFERNIQFISIHMHILLILSPFNMYLNAVDLFPDW